MDVVHPGVGTMEGKQLFMRTLFFDPSFFDDQELVGVTDGGKTMGNGVDCPFAVRALIESRICCSVSTSMAAVASSMPLETIPVIVDKTLGAARLTMEKRSGENKMQ
ncbi:MAG: hypothetical protein ILA55_06160 [Erysipelotrichaceae bacterium]|nr:hypothetical protein [Erysipelotrichaceae bacterium]